MNLLVKLACILLIVCGITMPLCAQSRKTQANKRSYDYVYKNSELRDDITMNYESYYDSDDHEIYHGPFSATAESKYDYNGIVAELKYKASGNYVDGVLDGPLNITVTESITRPIKANYTTSLVGSFKKGVATGNWTVKELGTYNGKSETNTMTALYKDGEIVSFTTSDGKKLTFDYFRSYEKTYTDYYEKKNKTDVIKQYYISGKWNDNEYVKGTNSKQFIRKNGKESAMDDEVTSILNDFKNGKISEKDVIDKGYVFDISSSQSKDIFGEWNDLLGYYGSEANGLNVYSYIKCSYTENRRRFNGNRNNCEDYTRILKKVDFTPAEKIIAKFGEDRDFKSKMYDLINDLNDLTPNKFYYRNQYYYVNNDSREKILAYLNKKDSELKNLKAMCDSLATFRKKYRSVKFLYSEVALFEKINYAEEWNVTEKDSTLLKDYLSRMKVYEEICETKIDAIAGAYNILEEIESSYPTIYNVYVKIFNEYLKKECPQDASLLNSYLQEIKGWQADKDCVKKYIPTYQETLNNASKINTNARKEVVNAYKKDFKATKIKFTANIKQSLDQIESWCAKQNQYIAIDSLWSIALKNDTLVSEKLGENLVDVNKSYAKYRKSNAIAINNDLGVTVENIKKIIEVQKGCLNFIDERAKIAEADARILTNGSAYKNIIKAYKNYMKGADIAWTEANDIQKLVEVQNVQAKFEAAFTKANVSDLDTAVKNSKDKSLNAILDILGK